jgi:pimeloyl-ACP methyl ester carboxylesterase
MEAQFLEVGLGASRRRIAYIRAPGGAPGMLWLAGFRSDMASTKATALAEWAGRRGLACTRFDYSGHGQSEGRFEDGTIGRWLDEARTVFAHATEGPQIVVGSSMGGYVALLLLRQLMAEAPADSRRIAALVLIAPAWNMTEALMWQQFPETAREALARDGVWHRPSQYGDPYPITRELIEEGRSHLIPPAAWDPGRPVHILHGRLDPDVSLAHSLALVRILGSDAMCLTVIRDGEHRLSRPKDLAVLFGIIEGLVDDLRQAT